MNKGTAIAAGTLSLLVLAGGITAASVFHKDVTLQVDGQTTPHAQAFGMTVDDVLEANHIMIGDGDIVSPAADSVVNDGQTITVRYLKHVTLTIDGQAVPLTTTEATLADAIDAAAAQLPDVEGASISVPTSSPLPRTGLTVAITTPKDIKLVVGGAKAKALTTTSATVGALLADQGIQASADDRLSPASETPIAEGMTVKLDRVAITTKQLTEAVPFKTVTKNNSSLWKGETRTTAVGKDGQAKRTYRITTVNGKVTDRVVESETIVVKPVDQVIENGTKTSPNGVGINLARAAQWDKIARCESGGRWHINTGNGYHGGLQFNLQTWRSVHGQDFAARPDQATREQQITVANRLYAKRGFQPWTCRRVL